jgi:hypothetical protein
VVVRLWLAGSMFQCEACGQSDGADAKRPRDSGGSLNDTLSCAPQVLDASDGGAGNSISTMRLFGCVPCRSYSMRPWGLLPSTVRVQTKHCIRPVFARGWPKPHVVGVLRKRAAVAATSPHATCSLAFLYTSHARSDQ